jgi:hypothetical protein
VASDSRLAVLLNPTDLIPRVYVLDPTAVVSAFGTAADDTGDVLSAPMHLATGEVTYLAEACFRAPEINLFPSYLNINGYYLYNFF